MSIRDKMRPLFRTLDGGLFSEKAGKADVGDAVSKLQAEGGTLMCWADPFYPDRVIPQKVLERSVEVIQQGGGLPLYPAHRQCGPERGHCEKKSSGTTTSK